MDLVPLSLIILECMGGTAFTCVSLTHSTQEMLLNKIKLKLKRVPWLGGSVCWRVMPYTKKGYRFNSQLRTYLGCGLDP